MHTTHCCVIESPSTTLFYGGKGRDGSRWVGLRVREEDEEGVEVGDGTMEEMRGDNNQTRDNKCGSGDK